MKEDCDQCLLPKVDVIMRSETPRTECYILNPHPESVPAAFARQLEQELKASKAEVERLKKELSDWDYGTRAKREQEARKKAEAEVERLKESLKAWTTID